ncbi:MAG TPA: division/cell wall cluster transcriptional repressor MraZ [Vicinamibacteria bacterium]
MLRGNHPARVDEKGRLKIPAGFYDLIQTNYGSDIFVTSVTGESARIYPMSVWTEVERRLGTMPDSHPAKVKFLNRVHFFGQAVVLDRQGRLVIPSLLRESAQIRGNVAVLGKFHFLEVWNQEYFLEKLAKEPMTDEDQRALSDFGI